MFLDVSAGAVGARIRLVADSKVVPSEFEAPRSVADKRGIGSAETLRKSGQARGDRWR